MVFICPSKIIVIFSVLSHYAQTLLNLPQGVFKTASVCIMCIGSSYWRTVSQIPELTCEKRHEVPAALERELWRFGKPQI
jgi:uncharacterized membrane protein